MTGLMPSLTIKNLPADLHARLKESAERHRRSLNAEAIVCLERGLGGGAVSPGELRDRLAAVRERAGGYLTDDATAGAKREGRA